MLEARVAELTAEVRAASNDMEEARKQGEGLYNINNGGNGIIEEHRTISPMRDRSPPRSPFSRGRKGTTVPSMLPSNTNLTTTGGSQSKVVTGGNLPRPIFDDFFASRPEFVPNESGSVGGRNFFSINPIDSLTELCESTNSVFRDYDFDTDSIDPILAAALGRGGHVDFKRLSELTPYSDLFGTTKGMAPAYEDISWGPTDLAHWLLTCLAIVIQEFSAQGREAQKERDARFIKNMGGAKFMIHPTHTSSCGCYVVQFFIDAKWRYVVVDDRIPCDTFGKPLIPTLLGNNGGLYLPLIIKAIAKLYGGYSGLAATAVLNKKLSPGLQQPYGCVAEALCDMSGGAALIPSMPHPRSEKFRPPWHGDATGVQRAAALEVFCDSIWDLLDDLLTSVGSELVAVVASDGNGLSRCGIHRILETATAEIPHQSVDGPHASGRRQIRLLRLHTPYNDSTWTGPWSPDSAEWSSAPRLAAALCPKTDVDGSYWIEFVDYLNNFEYFSAVKMFTGWNELSLTGSIVPRETPPWYQMQVTQTCKVFISIQHRDARLEKPTRHNHADFLTGRLQQPGGQTSIDTILGYKVVPERQLDRIVLQPTPLPKDIQPHMNQPVPQWALAQLSAGTYFVIPNASTPMADFALRVFAQSAFVLVERQGALPS